MLKAEPKVFAFLLAAGLTVATHGVSAGIDVKVEFDKAFDFKAANTWAWNTSGPGEVKMARTQEDDPEAMRQRAEPVIVDAVMAELGRRGLEFTATAPHVRVTYYLLLSTSMSTQTVGQFLPAVTMWGVPPFAPATQSLEVMNRGSLVLDMSGGNDDVVWRGVAQANIKIGADDKRREALLREAVKDLLRRFPPKS